MAGGAVLERFRRVGLGFFNQFRLFNVLLVNSKRGQGVVVISSVVFSE